jgi:hypothetical protein
VQHFLREPRECLPLFCVRLLAMFPTEYALLQGAGKIISAWLQGTFASIDFCERAHAQFRRDINSPTVGCDFTASSNTLLVRQWLASHISRGLCVNALIRPALMCLSGGASRRPLRQPSSQHTRANTPRPLRLPICASQTCLPLTCLHHVHYLLALEARLSLEIGSE